MKKMEKFIIRNWIWLLAGLVLTRKAVEFTYAERGYAAFGGEWLVLPVVLMFVYMARNVGRSFFVTNEFWEEAGVGDSRTSKYHRRM